MNEERVYTPPALAKIWRCDPATVLSHIRAGRLRAFTLSPPGCSRPRWRITAEAVEEFERRQSHQTPPRPKPRARRPKNVIEFF